MLKQIAQFQKDAQALGLNSNSVEDFKLYVKANKSQAEYREVAYREPDSTSLKSFDTFGLGYFKLGIIERKRLTSVEQEYMYVNEDLTKFTRGVYSGGATGAGVSDLHEFSDRDKFIRFVV